MASGIRASPAPVASSSRCDARGGSRARGRARARAAKIPRAARPATRAADGRHAQNGDDGPVGGGADGRVGHAPSVSSATTLAAVCASASLIFGAAHVIDANPALAVGTSADPRPSLADRDRRTASRMVDAFDALSREDKVRVVERLMFETESAMMERDDGRPGPGADGDVRAPTPRGWGEAGSGRNPEKPETQNDEDEKPSEDDEDEARYSADAARRRALLEPLASSSSSFSVDALREMDERDGWSTSNDDDVRDANPFAPGRSNKEPTKEPLVDPLLRGGGDDGATPSDSVFQKLFQWFREEGLTDLTDFLNDPNARYRAGSLVLVAALVLATLTESRGASADGDGNVEGSSPVPTTESSDSGDAVTRPETDDDDDAEDEVGDGKKKKKTKKKKLYSPARAGADGVLWSRRDDDDDAGLGGGRAPPAAGVLWTRAEDDGVDGAPRRREGARRRNGREGRRRRRLESSDDEDGDRFDRRDRFEELGEERERRGTFARAPSGSAPVSPPPAIGPVEDENMEGFRLSGRGRTQR